MADPLLRRTRLAVRILTQIQCRVSEVRWHSARRCTTLARRYAWRVGRIVSDQPFGGDAGFVAAFALHGDGPRDLDAVVRGLDRRRCEPAADARARGHGRDEANAVQAVVDRHPNAADADG